MKKIVYLFAILFAVTFASCGDSSNNDPADTVVPTNPGATNSSPKFGITGIELSVADEGSPARVSRAGAEDGAYVTWETWIENATWTLPYQPGSYTAWDIETPVNGSGDQIMQIVGMAQTCLFTDVDNITGTQNIFIGYFGSDYFYLTVRGTIHRPDGTTETSEYRSAIPITEELYNYINYEAMGKPFDTFIDRMTITLHFTSAEN